MAAVAATGFDPLRHRGMITATVMIASVIQVIDSTIANVALPKMQGSLSATQDQMSWVLTSYIVAAAIMTPLSGWFADRFGRKPVFLASLIGFTLASALCGMAQSLGQVVLFRLLQGACGAALSPMSQAVMLDSYPPAQYGRAMSIWGLGMVGGPMLGPVLGGWLTDSYSWRWVFYINVPIGVVAVLGVLAYLPDTKHTRRAFDFFGFTSLSLFVGLLQILLDRGPSRDWFNSTEIKVETLVAVLALYVFIVHTLTTQRPFIRMSLFKDRNFLAGSFLVVVVGMVMMATMSLLAPFLQELMNLSVLQTGYVMTPRSVGTLISMLLIGRVVGRVDTRFIIGCGLCLTAFSMWQMTNFSLQMNMRPIFWTGLLQGMGMGMVWVPMTTMTFNTLAASMRNEATSLFALVRNLSSSIGIATAQGLLVHNLQTAHAGLVAHITPYTHGLSQLAGGPGARSAARLLNEQVSLQAAMIAYLDDFKFLMIFTIAAIPVLLLVRSPGTTDTGANHVMVD